MPEKNLHHEWIMTLWAILSTALAGALGALVRQINEPKRKWTKRVIEWIAGACCAIYGAELVALTLYHSLEKLDLINQGHVIPEKITGLAGFLCGALGVEAINGLIILIKGKTK
ncbi:MAG: hypothetical protein JSC189_000449 [Candidatus Tokpelaia sp. JSC189]|nr:MAG: hypothetical protein JSC189_000449 [Candidatus Tokpelaia sp. JSC189]